MDIGEVFFEAVSDGANRQAQHPICNRRDIGAYMLSFSIEIITPDDIGYHRDCLFVLGDAGLCCLQGFPQLFLSLRTVDDIIAHDYH